MGSLEHPTISNNGNVINNSFLIPDTIYRKLFYKSQNNIQVDLFSEDDSNLYDPKNRSIYSRPMRPAIFLE